MTEESGMDFTLIDYSQHALSQGSEAKAAAYICLRDNRSGKETYGVGVSANITRAGFRAFFQRCGQTDGRKVREINIIKGDRR